MSKVTIGIDSYDEDQLYTALDIKPGYSYLAEVSVDEEWFAEYKKVCARFEEFQVELKAMYDKIQAEEAAARPPINHAEFIAHMAEAQSAIINAVYKMAFNHKEPTK